MNLEKINYASAYNSLNMKNQGSCLVNILLYKFKFALILTINKLQYYPVGIDLLCCACCVKQSQHL